MYALYILGINIFLKKETVYVAVKPHFRKPSGSFCFLPLAWAANHIDTEHYKHQHI